MVEIVCTEPAPNDLDTIADYIALDNPRAAAQLVQRVFAHVEPPCRAIYRHEKGRVFILHVVRAERLLKKRLLARTSKSNQ